MRFVGSLEKLLAYLLGFGLGIAYFIARGWSIPGLAAPLTLTLAITLISLLVPAIRRARWFPASIGLFGALAIKLFLTSASTLEFHGRLTILGAIPKISTLFCILAFLAFTLSWLQSTKQEKALSYRYGFLLALGLIVVYFSTSKGAADPMIAWAMRQFQMDHEQAAGLILLFRKSIHFLFYGTVAAAAWATLSQAHIKKSFPRIILCGAYVLTNAAFDEYRQSFFKGRTSSLTDIGIDLLGAVVAILLLSKYKK